MNLSLRNASKEWNEQEMVNLIYLVDKIGEDWLTIEKHYAKHFQNKYSSNLRFKYRCLEKDKIHFEELKNKASLVTHIEIIDTPVGKVKTQEKARIWSEEEVKITKS